MAIAFDRPGIEELCARLAPSARALLERCGDYALAMHADEVGPEHLLSTLMEDESCAAHRAVVSAFADPATIADEARALSSGIMVSGSSASIAFSALGVRAVREARALAARRGDPEVAPAHLLLAAFAELPEDLRAALDDAGWSPERVEQTIAAAPAGASAVAQTGHLFRSFSDEAKRLLSAAARTARQGQARSISAAHMFQAGLQADAGLERAAGLSAARARVLLRGRSQDDSPVEGGPLALDEALERFLAGAPPGADSLDLLRRCHAGETPELAQVLTRHRVTPSLLDRARAAFRDP